MYVTGFMLGKCFPTVSEAELKRLKDVFKRSSTLSGSMTQNVFIKEVLGDGVPQRLAEVHSTHKHVHVVCLLVHQE